ncbi:hypothetical protein [Desulfobaculum bizertense]|uniref:Uncharacterized protein n=1 Tax=Desulfobaculum bizertense DSM 18034 TaxID=1121442 RepID=A0A1T4W229_9BACT|nr:hypothetical protein [Desulfobaculum bizertense]UIJ38862.1 hypothetical protein LWC08_04615 [Desulfobaculum bizertense]SKA71354.1 hypothetical protein SAMN02745702_01462 [Desulfobaculum bizertense DSM 18034]
MANMDYPGPCPNCGLVESCTTQEQREEGIKTYCKGMEMELNAWKARLFDAFAQAEGHNDLQDSLNLIKSIVREIEMQKDKMLVECPTSISDVESDVGKKFGELRGHYTKLLEQLSAGFVGG